MHVCFLLGFEVMIAGKTRGKQAYCRKSMTDNAARIFNLDVYKGQKAPGSHHPRNQLRPCPAGSPFDILFSSPLVKGDLGGIKKNS
jgi:hypothetical protein